ncbi:MAG: hypothetical protein CMB77_02075 [Euryarchaeota archaeon]|nr:hypothetical protein [Euryarchaeota archaeon]
MNINTGQLLGLDLDRHILLDAGAGTGKTRVMSERYVLHILDPMQRAVRFHAAENRQVGVYGLRPSEIVALTFTVDAAQELKDRIRSVLMERIEHRDPRLSDADPLDVLSDLDQASIGTIDSFITQLIQPWRSTLFREPNRRLVEDDERTTLNATVVDAVLRINSIHEASTLGLTQVELEDLTDLRHRMLIAFGSRNRLVKVISKLRDSAGFASEAEMRMASSIGHQRLSINSEDALKLDIIDIDLNDAQECLDRFISLAERMREPDAVESLRLMEMDPGTRVHSFLQTTDLPRPTNLIGTMQRIGHLLRILTSSKDWSETSSHPFESGRWFQTKDNWPHGISTPSKLKAAKHQSVLFDVRHLMEEISGFIESLAGQRIRDASIDVCCHHPPDMPNVPVALRPTAVGWSNFTPVPEGLLNLSAETDLGLIVDAVRLGHLVAKVDRHIKEQRRLEDHSDVAEAAEDLLITRCPAICRSWYPGEMVDALDSDLNIRPGWSDIHITEALRIGRALGKDTAGPALEDLEQRISRLRNIRTRYRAYIIDEFQDTSPQQWRLLTRLFCSTNPISPIMWQPTVCVVGDVKQSIYRFRQADVAVMRLAGDQVAAANAAETSLRPAWVQDELVRDPRSTPPTSEGSFQSASSLHSDLKTLPLTTGLSTSDTASLIHTRRTLGLITLDENFRTRGDLLRTIDQVVSNVFDEVENHAIWDAPSQHLHPCDDRADLIGSLEWLIPINSESPNPSLESQGLGKSPEPGDRGLEHDLVARRLSTLLEHPPEWLTSPRDIMILVQTRTHVSDLIDRLQRLGLPVASDSTGSLFNRPVGQILRALIDLAARPHDRLSLATLARSPMLDLDDKTLHKMMFNNDETDGFKSLLSILDDGDSRKWLVRDWIEHRDDAFRLLQTSLDWSDLLVAFSQPKDVIDADRFMRFIHQISLRVGSGVAQLSNELDLIESHDVEVTTNAPDHASTMRVMTIHKSKGLQSPLVVLTGLFDDGWRSHEQDKRSNILVTPDRMALRARPYATSTPVSGPFWMKTERYVARQNAAEKRRLLYVAATRAQDHLIVAGAPAKTFLDKEGCLNVPMPRNGKHSLGEMWLNGFSTMVSTSQMWERNLVQIPKRVLKTKESPVVWGNETESIDVLRFDPVAVGSDAGLPIGHIKSIHVDWTGSDSSPSLEDEDLIKQMKDSTSLEWDSTNELTSTIQHPLRWSLSPSSIDEQSRSLNSASSDIEYTSEIISKIHEVSDEIPANVIGDALHRMLEIGLPNPGLTPDGYAIPADWCRPAASRYLDDDLISEVVHRAPTDHKTELGSALQEMLNRIDRGSLGSMFRGDGPYDVVGVRTEWSFSDEWILSLENGPHAFRSTPFGPMKRYTDEVHVEVSGRVDLILVLRQNEGHLLLLPIDIKTDGWTRPDVRVALEDCISNNEQVPVCDEEATMLENHIQQMVVYHRVLKRWAKARSREGAQIEVIPGGLLIATNGRLVCWSDDQMDEHDQKLDSILSSIITSELG